MSCGGLTVAAVLAALSDVLRTGIILVDRERRVVALSPWLEDHLNGRLGSVVGRRFEDLPDPAAAGADSPLLTLETGQGRDVFLQRCPFTGRTGPVRMRTVLVPDDRGEPAGVAVLLEEARGALALAAGALDAGGDSPAAWRQLTAGAAHEIRNPLAGVRGFLQLLADRLSGEEERRYLSIVLQEIDRINELTRYLLAMTRSDQEAWEEGMPSAVVREVLNRCQPRAETQRVGVTVIPPAVEVAAVYDRRRLAQVLINLLHNALDATPAGGRVTVTCGINREAGHYFIDVADTGSGIAPEHLPHVFEPYYTTKVTGTGLGLALCRRFMLEQGGSIEVDSCPGLGACFRLTLPLAPAAAVPRRTAAPEII